MVKKGPQGQQKPVCSPQSSQGRHYSTSNPHSATQSTIPVKSFKGKDTNSLVLDYLQSNEQLQHLITKDPKSSLAVPNSVNVIDTTTYFKLIG